MAENLEEVHNRIEGFLQIIKEPRSHEDLDMSLYQIERDVLSYSHSEGDSPTIEYETTVLGDAQQTIDPSRLGLEYAKEHDKKAVIFEFGVTGSESIMTYSHNLGEFYSWATWSYISIRRVTDQHSNLLNQFDSDILNDIEASLDNILLNILSNMSDVGDIIIDPEDYGSTEEIGDDIYGTYIIYDGIEEDASKLARLSDELEEIRKRVIQTSYS